MKVIFMSEKSAEKPKTSEMDFEARQNALGFFSVALGVVLRNPELRKKIFNENNENNRDTNTANKAQ